MSKRVLGIAVALVIAGCSCSGTARCPPGDECPCQTDSECLFEQTCEHGVCIGIDAGHTHVDAGHPGDAGVEHHDAGQQVVDAGSMEMGGAITCKAAVNNYQMNGGSCGTERWSVKTGTDSDVESVNTVPEETRISTLRALPVPANQSASCDRNAPTETQVWLIKNVNIHFVTLETDSDYHMVISDSSSDTMIVESVWPGCVGHDSCSSDEPFLCEITHVRANADAIEQSRTDQVGTVAGIGFFDFLHGQTGVAPNGIELHPLLGICFGQDCNPFEGY